MASPTLDYGSPQKPRKILFATPLEWLVILGIIALLISIILPTLARMREKSSIIPCASNLSQIGMAIQLYAMDNGSAYPPDLPTILRTQKISPKAFVCPQSTDTPAKGRTPADQAAQLMNGHCSYIYVGRGFTTKVNPECIVAFADPGHHALEGTHILVADGHVEFVPLGYVAPLLSELEQGHNPPRHPPPPLTKQQFQALYQRDWLPELPALKSGQWSASLPATRPTTRHAQP